MFKPFDFNKDGKMDAFERAAEFQFLNDVVFNKEEAEEYELDFETECDDDFSDDY